MTYSRPQAYEVNHKEVCFWGSFGVWIELIFIVLVFGFWSWFGFGFGFNFDLSFPSSPSRQLVVLFSIKVSCLFCFVYVFCALCYLLLFHSNLPQQPLDFGMLSVSIENIALNFTWTWEVSFFFHFLPLSSLHSLLSCFSLISHLPPSRKKMVALCQWSQ